MAGREGKMRLIWARAWVSTLCRDQTGPWAYVKPVELIHLVKKGLEKPHLPAPGAGKEPCLCWWRGVPRSAGPWAHTSRGGGQILNVKTCPGTLLPTAPGRQKPNVLWDYFQYPQGKQAPWRWTFYKQYRIQGNTPPQAESEDAGTSISTLWTIQKRP